MKNIALAAEYCRIIGVKRSGLFYRVCNDTSVTILDGGNVFLISFTTFYVFVEIRPFTLLLLILIMPPVPISWLHVAAWIVVSFSLYSVLLIFFNYIIFSPFILIV